MIGHERALDLAATAIDFELSPADRSALEGHLASCPTCPSEGAALLGDADRLRALRPVPPPAWVGRAIGRRRRPVGLVLSFVLLALSGLLAVAAAGSIQLPPFVERTPAPTPRSSPAAYPTVLLNTAVRVTAPEIVLRQVPSSAGAEIARAAQDAVLVTDSALRVRADGFDWYHAAIASASLLVPPLPGAFGEGTGASGWIAVRSDVEAFATPVPPRCPQDAVLENVVAMLEAERLACFGGGTIEVEGTFTCSSCGGGASGVYEPVWLASPTTAALVGPGGASGPSLPLHFAPSGTAMPAEGARISVRGHFDDPAATTCRLALPMPGEPDASLSPVDVDSVILLCRQAFVVESYEGTPSPPGPRFDLDAVVSVVEGPLRVRSLPRVADDSDKFDPLLQTGQLLFVIDGPIRASEYDWYLVQTIGGPGHVGWVASADHDGTAWLELANVDCPADPEAVDVGQMAGEIRLHCYGSRELQLFGSISSGPMCGDGGGVGGTEWVASCRTSLFMGPDEVPLLDPDGVVQLPPDWPDGGPFDAMVVAHMDDPAARTCEPSGSEVSPYPELAKASAVVSCRATFVVTSFEPAAP